MAGSDVEQAPCSWTCSTGACSTVRCSVQCRCVASSRCPNQPIQPKAKTANTSLAIHRFVLSVRILALALIRAASLYMGPPHSDRSLHTLCKPSNGEAHLNYTAGLVMPIHEYTCTVCRAEFEELVRGEESIECPVCHEARVERRFSTFATSNPAKASPAQSSPMGGPGGCGTCGDPRGPGACQL